jgi:hypothetical protein
MNPLFAAIGGLFAVAGLVVLYFWRKAGQELALMKATPTSRAADVGAMAPDTIVALKGPVRCETPLLGEFSQQTCVYYRAVIEREYERRVRDSKGETRTENHRETVQSNERFAPCHVQDDSGRVAVDFTGAKVEGVQSVKRFEPASSSGVGALVGGLLGVSGSRDIGLHYTETLIAPDVPIYVLGAVQPGGSVGRSHGKKAPFIVSTKSEEQREHDVARTRLWQMIGAGVCFAIAVVLLIVAMNAGPSSS